MDEPGRGFLMSMIGFSSQLQEGHRGLEKAAFLTIKTSTKSSKITPSLTPTIGDDVAKVPYVYSPENSGVFSTYEDVQSIKGKTDYVKSQGLGGMFFWDLSSDLPGNHPNSLVSTAASELNHIT